MPTWDGKTERRNHPSDHDNLTRTIVLLENHIKNFDSHISEDKKNFDFLNKSVWMVFGGVAILELWVKLIK